MTLSKADDTARGPDAAPAATPTESGAACLACDVGRLSRELVNTAFWHNNRLLVVQDIPALVCTKCGEQFHRVPMRSQL